VQHRAPPRGRRRGAGAASAAAAKGIGPVGADIFRREVQIVWDEAFPYADRRVLEVAKRLGLPRSAEELSKLGSRKVS
jgi:hypothetical protein